MALPRLGLKALFARLHLNKDQLVTIVEGAVDKRCLLRLVHVPNAQFIEIREIESSIADEFHGYGDNKARILSLFSDPKMADFADKNAIGIVDKDLDGVVRENKNIVGVYYTPFSCLVSFVSDGASVNEMLSSIFGIQVIPKFIAEIQKFSRNMYFLRGYVQLYEIGYALPDLDKCVRSIEDGGFNWDRYINAIVQQTNLTRESISLNIAEQVQTFSARDERDNNHFHSTSKYIALLLRKERLTRSPISSDEIERHLVGLYLRKGPSCPIVGLVNNRAVACLSA